MEQHWSYLVESDLPRIGLWIRASELPLTTQEPTERLGVQRIPEKWSRWVQQLWWILPQAWTWETPTVLFANSHRHLIWRPQTWQHREWKCKRTPGDKTCWQGPFAHHDPSGTRRLWSGFPDVCTAYAVLGNAGEVAQCFQSPSRAPSGSLPVCVVKHAPLKLPLPEWARTVGPRKRHSVIVAAEDTWCSFHCRNIYRGLSRFHSPFQEPSSPHILSASFTFMSLSFPMMAYFPFLFRGGHVQSQLAPLKGSAWTKTRIPTQWHSFKHAWWAVLPFTPPQCPKVTPIALGSLGTHRRYLSRFCRELRGHGRIRTVRTRLRYYHTGDLHYCVPHTLLCALHS